MEETPALLARRKRNVDMRFSGVPPRLEGVPGVSAVDGRRRPASPAASKATCAPFLAAIAARGVVDLTIEPARLEEAFLEFYEGAGRVNWALVPPDLAFQGVKLALVSHRAGGLGLPAAGRSMRGSARSSRR